MTKVNIKYRKFIRILKQAIFADVELIVRAKKLSNGNFEVFTCYELSQDQLEALGITPSKKVESETMPRESKPPKWAIELISTVNTLVQKVDSIDERLINIEKDVKDMKNTPTMKREFQGE